MNSRATRGDRAISVVLGAFAILLASCGSTTAHQAGANTNVPNQLLANYQPVQLSFSPADHSQGVAPDTVVHIYSNNGTLQSVDVHAAGETTPLAGVFSVDKSSWTASTGVLPGAQYVASAVATSDSGNSISGTSSFSAAAGQRLITTADPGDGETVGIGMPIKLDFNTSVPDAAQFNLVSHLRVVSDPPQDGAWHWFAPWEVHYRPKTFWQPHTKITVYADLLGVNAGDNYYGFGNWSEAITVGDSHVSKIDHNTEMMQVYTNDQLVNTIPVALGKPGFPTISGTLVVWTKTPKIMMNSCPSGIDCTPGTANYYKEDVLWDTAISTDGFFIHDAYWDIFAQGHYDYSHGCVNVSPDNAIWFYNYAVKGDIVEIANTARVADAGDGEGDWQLPFAQFANSGGAPSSLPKASGGGV